MDTLKKLVTKECANYDKKFNGINNHCLIRKDSICVFFTTKENPCCNYFEQAVLPLDKEHEIKYYNDKAKEKEEYKAKLIEVQNNFMPKRMIKCAKCNNVFPANSNRQKYCDKCKKYAERERKKNWIQKQRKEVSM